MHIVLLLDQTRLSKKNGNIHLSEWDGSAIFAKGSRWRRIREQFREGGTKIRHKRGAFVIYSLMFVFGGAWDLDSWWGVEPSRPAKYISDCQRIPVFLNTTVPYCTVHIFTACHSFTDDAMTISKAMILYNTNYYNCWLIGDAYLFRPELVVQPDGNNLDIYTVFF